MSLLLNHNSQLSDKKKEIKEEEEETRQTGFNW